MLNWRIVVRSHSPSYPHPRHGQTDGTLRTHFQTQNSLPSLHHHHLMSLLNEILLWNMIEVTSVCLCSYHWITSHHNLRDEINKTYQLTERNFPLCPSIPPTITHHGPKRPTMCELCIRIQQIWWPRGVINGSVPLFLATIVRHFGSSILRQSDEDGELVRTIIQRRMIMGAHFSQVHAAHSGSSWTNVDHNFKF